jgi:hypothetical protein
MAPWEKTLLWKPMHQDYNRRPLQTETVTKHGPSFREPEEKHAQLRFSKKGIKLVVNAIGNISVGCFRNTASNDEGL